MTKIYISQKYIYFGKKYIYTWKKLSDFACHHAWKPTCDKTTISFRCRDFCMPWILTSKNENWHHMNTSKPPNNFRTQKLSYMMQYHEKEVAIWQHLTVWLEIHCIKKCVLFLCIRIIFLVSISMVVMVDLKHARYFACEILRCLKCRSWLDVFP